MRRVLLFLSLILAPGLAAAAPDDEWAALRDGAVGLMRHGGAVLAAPGTAPPVPGCDPTAVLTDIGRDEMRRFGERLRAEGVPAARVLVSRQCSAWESAKLLGIGRVTHEPALDPPPSPAERDARRDALARTLFAAATTRDTSAVPTIFITHRLNIAALTGIEVVQGEMLLLRPQPGGGLSLVGRITSE